MRSLDRARLRIAVSFGGTKIAVALLDANASRVVARSERIEWRLHPLWDHLRPLESLMAMVVNEILTLMERHIVSFSDVDRIGIAWPGPGNYERGLLRATFIPGLEQEADVHQTLRDALKNAFGPCIEHILIASGLDAHARALGELSLPNGAFAQERSTTSTNGIVLNIATGIAGVIVISGRTLRTWDGLGSTYGQWGRFAFRNRHSGEWIWRPTVDGSIARHAPEDVRLTEQCGGPALWRRYSQLDGQVHHINERDVIQERLCLHRITCEAYTQNAQATDFVRAVGTELAGAIECILNAFQLPHRGTKVVLTGGIGEFFGAPTEDASGGDVLLAAIGDAGMPCNLLRSRAGLDAELAGAVLFS